MALLRRLSGSLLVAGFLTAIVWQSADQGDPQRGGTKLGALREGYAADPALVVDGVQPWLFITNNLAGNVPVVSLAAGEGVVAADALPELPSWSEPGRTWAPAVTQTDESWVLAFTARHAASGRQCIGLATSPDAGGPYTAAEDPLICDLDRGGSIDPSFVVDETGSRWLLYKDDGNCCNLPTTLRSVPLTADGTALAGEPVDLLGADQPWEGGLVEGPTMRQVAGRWLLLYSGNRWDTEDYAVGAAWCETPAGPCTKQPEPALTAGAGMDGPGGAEFVSGGPRDAVAVTFHAWDEGQIGEQHTRQMHLAQVQLRGGHVGIEPLMPLLSDELPAAVIESGETVGFPRSAWRVFPLPAVVVPAAGARMFLTGPAESCRASG